jgi:pimeloyl-ACP methyl ester carboxylesterase
LGCTFCQISQDAKNIAIELYELLRQAGEREPFVLVAASVARFYAEQYINAFPTDVAGLVLVDPSTPEQIAEIPGVEIFARADQEEASGGQIGMVERG